MHDIGKKTPAGRVCLIIGTIAMVLVLTGLPVWAGKFHLLGLGGGYAGVLDNDKTAYGCIEYRPPVTFFILSPWTSVEFSDSFFYGAAGILIDFNLTNRLALTPSFGAGIYSQNNGMKLGHPLEFRSALELSWRLKNSGRLALSFGHISNGGLDDTNPGSELLKIVWLIPLGPKSSAHF